MPISINERILWTIGGIYIVLLLASVILWILKKRGIQLKEVEQRVKSWWIMATIFVVAISISRNISFIFFALISFLALKEYFSIIPTRRADRRILFWAYLAIPFQYYWIATEWYGMFIIFIPVYMFLYLPMRMVLIGDTKDFLRAAGTLHWGMMMMVFSLSHLAYLLVLDLKSGASAGGPGLVLYLVILTQLNDVAQFLWGKALGKRKIVPKVSPNKTWAGFLGGLTTTILMAGALAPLLTPMNWQIGFLLGALIGMAGFIGDVTVSALKRDLDIKDSGQLIPGHGGILDRVDSLTYTAPLFFHVTRYFYGL